MRRSDLALGGLASLILLLLAVPLVNGTGLAGSAEAELLPLARLLQLALSSAAIGFVAAGFAVLLGLAAVPALMASSRPLAWRLFLLSTLLLPPVVHAVAAVRLTSGAPWFPIYTPSGVGIVLGWWLAPLAVLIIERGARGIAPELIEAARLEGSSAQVFVKVWLPAMIPSLAMAAGAVFLLAVLDLSVAETLRATPSLAREIYVQFGVYYNPPGALASSLALGAVLLLPAGMLLVLGQRLLAPRDVEVSTEFTASSATTPRSRWIAGLSSLATVAPPLLLLGTLLTSAVGPQGIGSELSGVFHLTAKEVLFTLTLCLLAAPLVTALSLALALLASASRYPRLWVTLLALLILVPAPFTAVALKQTLLLPPGGWSDPVRPFLLWLEGTPAPLLAAWLLHATPYGALYLFSHWRRADPTWREAAFLEASGFGAQWRAWGWAWSKGPLLVVLLGSGALLYGEAGAALLLVPPGTTTVSIRLLTLLHYAPTAQVGVLCLLMIAPALILAGLAIAAGRTK